MKVDGIFELEEANVIFEGELVELRMKVFFFDIDCSFFLDFFDVTNSKIKFSTKKP